MGHCSVGLPKYKWGCYYSKMNSFLHFLILNNKRNFWSSHFCRTLKFLHTSMGHTHDSFEGCEQPKALGAQPRVHRHRVNDGRSFHVLDYIMPCYDKLYFHRDALQWLWGLERGFLGHLGWNSPPEG